MDNMQKIAAVSWRARKLGLTYGEVAEKLTQKEAETLYAEFAAYLKKKKEAAATQRAREKKKPRPLAARSGKRKRAVP